MNRQAQVVPQHAGGASALPASSYWKHIVPLAMLMIMVIGARIHDGVPLVGKIRPALSLAVVGGAFAFLRTRREVIMRALNNTVYRSQLMYFGWAAIGAPFALWIGGAVAALQSALPALTLSLCVLLCPPTVEVMDRLQRGIVLGCTGTAMSAMVFGFITSEGRLSTNGSLDPNDLAAVMTLGFPLAMGLLSRERGLMRKLFWLACSGLLVVVLMKAGSRGGMLAIVTSTICYVAGQRGSRRPVFAVLCVVGGIAAWGVATPRFKNKIVAMIHGEQDYNYTAYAGRKQVWARARMYTLYNPVFGVGIGNFPVAEGESCRRDFPDQGCKWSTTHNSYFQASAELGIPGVLLFITMLVRGGVTALRLVKLPRGSPLAFHRPELFASLAGFATSAVFLSHAYFYLMFALLAVIAHAVMTQRLSLAAMHAAPPGAGRAPFPPPSGAPVPAMAGAPGMAGRLGGAFRGPPRTNPRGGFAGAPGRMPRPFGTPRR